MSTVKVNAIRSTTASSDGLTLDGSGNITAPGNTTCSGNLAVTKELTAKNFANRNLIINGAMNVAQRGTSSTSISYQTVDRFQPKWANTDEDCTQSQHALTSADTGPWEKGFMKSLHIQNGNQTSGAGTSDNVTLEYKLESQDTATCGWDFKSSTSFLTFSFWVKSSVAQEFLCQFYNSDTNKIYTFNYTVTSANTWQKITHKLKGDPSLSFNMDNGAGLEIGWYLFVGTDQTAASSSANETWATYSGTTSKKDMTSTWYTTNDATWEITGVQLEVGEVASEFEHRSYGDELRRCKRYYEIFYPERANPCWTHSAIHANCRLTWEVEKRATPTCTLKGSTSDTPGASDDHVSVYDQNGWNTWTSLTFTEANKWSSRVTAVMAGGSFTAGWAVGLYFYNDSGIYVSAEL